MVWFTQSLELISVVHSKWLRLADFVEHVDFYFRLLCVVFTTLFQLCFSSHIS